jgi:hypothetical protein
VRSRGPCEGEGQWDAKEGGRWAVPPGPSVRVQGRGHNQRNRHLRLHDLGDGILDVASGLPDLGDRPLVVVTAAAEPLDGWLAQQDRLATLSTNVSHRVFPDLTHVSLIESAKGATAASDAIRAVVTSVRSGTRLDSSTASQR